MKVAVIGLGSMGKRRIRLLKHFDKNIEIIGIDSKKSRIEEIVEKFGIKCFTQLSEINDVIDCAFVCTSPQFHGDIIHDCLEKNCNVFSEINLLDYRYEENIFLAQEKGKVLFLSSTPIYKAEMQYIDKRIKTEDGKHVYSYHVGQYLPDWHPWDNLNEFFISKKETNGCRELLAIELPWIQNTFGKIVNIRTIKRKITSLDIDFPDVYLIHIEHENGNVGSLLVDIVSRQATRLLEIIGENTYIKWSGTPDSLYQKNIQTGEIQNIDMGEYFHEQGYDESINEFAYLTEIQEFFSVISGGKAKYGFSEDKEIISWIDQIEI